MRILIIEDETAAAVNLQAILKKISPESEVVGILESVAESVEWLQRHPMPELIFMDIHLADGDSFRIFHEVEITAPIIFATAYDQYALEAFKVNSIDYLLKPIAETDLKRAFEKWQRLVGHERELYRERVRTLTEQQESRREQPQVFLVHHRDKIIPLKRDEIAYCYTRDERVVACNMQGEVYALDKTLEYLQGILPADAFFRANRQFIIARRAVKDISVWFGNRLTLSLTVKEPERIVISKARVPEFKQWLMAIHPSK